MTSSVRTPRLPADQPPATMAVQRDLVPLLLGSGPIVIVPAGEESTGASLLSPATHPGGFGLVVFQPATDGQPAGFRRLDGQIGNDPLRLDVVPSGPCLLVARTAAGLDVLGALRTWWASVLPSSVPEVVLPVAPHDQGTGEEAGWQVAVYRRLVELAIDESKTSARREGALNAQLHELRIEHEHARAALVRMQDLLELRHPRWHLAFALSPVPDQFVPTSSSGEEVRQLLPVPAESLAAVDLHSSADASARPGDGFLVVELIARETGELLGHWAVPYRFLHKGWIRCALPSALAHPSHAVDLIVRWTTVDGPPPSLSLADVGDSSELSARCGESSLGKALAMLLWAGPPGSKLGSNGGVWLDSAERTGLVASCEYALGPRDFVRARRTTPHDWEYSHSLPESAGFRLHPLNGAVAGVLVPSTCLPGTDRVVATVTVPHERARYPVEVAMVVRSPDGRLTAFPNDPAHDPDLHGFSGWKSVPPDGEPKALIVDLHAPLHRSADLLLATRLPDGASNEDEWADFTEVRLRLRLRSP